MCSIIMRIIITIKILLQINLFSIKSHNFSILILQIKIILEGVIIISMTSILMKVITFITLGIVIMTRIINKRGSKYRRNDY